MLTLWDILRIFVAISNLLLKKINKRPKGDYHHRILRPSGPSSPLTEAGNQHRQDKDGIIRKVIK